MPITITADRVDELPEALRQHAKEADGKFVLSAFPEGFGIDNVGMLRSKMTKAEKDAARAAEKLKTFAKNEAGDLFDAEEFRQLLEEHARLKEAQGKAPNIEEMRKSIYADAEKTYGKKLTDQEKLAAKYLADLERTMRDAAISEAVAEARPKEGKADLVRLLLREKVRVATDGDKRVVQVIGADGTPVLGTGGNEVSVKDFAINVLRTQHADLFSGDGESGAGAGNSGGTGRKTKYTFPRAELNGRVAEYHALEAKARAEGQTVEFV